MSGASYNDGSKLHDEMLSREVNVGALDAEREFFPHEEKPEPAKCELTFRPLPFGIWPNLIGQFLWQLTRGDCGHPAFHSKPEPFQGFDKPFPSPEETFRRRRNEVNARLAAIEWMQSHQHKDAA